jgi:hypothetical protein
MSPHKKVYCKAFGYTSGDFIASEVSGSPAVDIHAIIEDGMGGRPNKDTHRVENLIALTRKEHIMYGGKSEARAWLFRVHLQHMEQHGVKFDRKWILEQIEKCKPYAGIN